MALPTPEKTWQFAHATIEGSSGNNTTLTWHRAIFLAMKAGLEGFGTSPLTVVSSSNASTAGAGDNIGSTASNLTWANNGSAHSWIVWSFGSGQICFDCNVASNAGAAATIAVSPTAAFSGGSTTARPTAADEYTTISGTQWFGNRLSLFGRMGVHVAKATDNSALFVIGCDGTGKVPNVNAMFWVVQNPVSGLTNTLMGGWVSNSSGTVSPSVSSWNDTASLKGYQGGAVSAFLASYGVINATTGETYTTRTSLYDAKWGLQPVILASTTASKAGLYGRLHDVYWGNSYHGSGRVYTADGNNYAWVHFGNLVFPWDSASPVLE